MPASLSASVEPDESHQKTLVPNEGIPWGQITGIARVGGVDTGQPAGAQLRYVVTRHRREGLRVADPASSALSQKVLQDHVVEHRISQKPLQSRVLSFKRLELVVVRNLKPAQPRLPLVKDCLANTVPAADLHRPRGPQRFEAGRCPLRLQRSLHQGRRPGAILEASCWALDRRKFFARAELQKAPVAIEHVRQIDKLFAIEHELTGKTPAERCTHRQSRSKPIVDAFEIWIRVEWARPSSKAPVAKAIDYSLQKVGVHALRRRRSTMPLEHAAERAVRGFAIGRPNWTFCGSDAGSYRAAAMFKLIGTCKLNDVDSYAWLAYILARIAVHPAKQVASLLPKQWEAARAFAHAV